MGYKTRTKIKKQQHKKRRKTRAKIVKGGGNPDHYFATGIKVKRN